MFEGKGNEGETALERRGEVKNFVEDEEDRRNKEVREEDDV